MITKIINIWKYGFWPYQENPENGKSNSFHENRPINIFLHVYAANHWQTIFNELITEIKTSGLYDDCHAIYISLISDNIEDMDYISSIGGEKINIINHTSDAKVYEFPALEALIKLANNTDNFYALYIHSKGSGNCRENVSNYWPLITSYKDLRYSSDTWRAFMSYYCISHWKMAIKKLHCGYDTYGVHFVPMGKHRFYGGNFWWAKSEYIKTLPPIQDTEKKDRYRAETWLLSNNNVKYYNACSIPKIATYTGIPTLLYRGSSLTKCVMRLIFLFQCIAKKIAVKTRSHLRP